MGYIQLVTGGGRSGKSSYALALANDVQGRRCFIATCPLVDDEMKERVRKHREERPASEWDTIEEEIDLSGALKRASDYDVVIVDCLSLWVSNLMYRAAGRGRIIEEEEITFLCSSVLGSCGGAADVIFVTNEVGMGIIPENREARLYRDLLGRCNQVIAAGADEVTFMVSGIAMKIK